MKLKILIEMDNAAFEVAAAREVERILIELIGRLTDHPKHGLQADVISLRDINGNKVGKAQVVE